MTQAQGVAPKQLEDMKPSAIIDLLWGDRLTISSRELMLLQAKDKASLLDQYVKVKWFNFSDIDLCSIRVSGPRGDDEVYQVKSIQRLLPRTFIIPWSRADQGFDVSQAITGLTKIAGMQDEGVDQVIDVEAVNQGCVDGELVSVEKANGKACVCWSKCFAGEWMLGFGSKTAVDPSYIYPMTAPLRGESSWLDWVTTQLQSMPVTKSSDPIIAQVARHTFTRLSQMSSRQINDFIGDLKSGITLCGELEEGGRHVVPSAHRVVYFVGSQLTAQGIKLDSPLHTLDRLATLNFQRHGELHYQRSPFTPLSAQPASLELSPGLAEGYVRYFLSARGDVVATMKIKDPHYMFYRKLRNAMCSSATSAPAILKRLAKSVRDPYYQACLRRASLPSDFNQVMLRSAASFLSWFVNEPTLGERFELAGFQGEQIGLGALLSRWRVSANISQLGEYHHLITHPELYCFPKTWLELGAHGSVAMVALHGAQGSGKSTLSHMLSEEYTQRSLESLRDPLSPAQIAHLCIAVEQDPLQKKILFTEWRESQLFPLFKRWLTQQGVELMGDELPQSVSTLLTWESLGEGKAGAKFIILLDHLELAYKELCDCVKTAHGERSWDDDPPPLIFINARCNQNQQATQRWRDWLDQKSRAGLSTIRLNAPLELLRDRISKRGRYDDQELIGEPVERTFIQVKAQRYLDLELDASMDQVKLLELSLPMIDLALKRM